MQSSGHSEDRLVEMVNRLEELLMRLKKTAREIEAKVRTEVEATTSGPTAPASEADIALPAGADPAAPQ